MVRRPEQPGQSWTTFLRNHAAGIAAADLFGETHLRRIVPMWARYYNEVRTHLSLGKDAPISRPIARFGRIIAEPVVGGLHHRYPRI